MTTKKSILDFRPVNEWALFDNCGAEPSLRELVFKYYDTYIPDEAEAALLAKDYCEQVEEGLAVMRHQND